MFDKENQVVSISKKRIFLFLVFLCIFAVFVLSKFALTAWGYQGGSSVSDMITERGPILDRNGRVLAVQTMRYNLCVTLASVSDPEELKNLIAPVVEMTPEEIQKIFDSASPVFTYIKKDLNQEQADSLKKIIEDNNISGVKLEPVQGRIYPEKSMAAHVIGFLGKDGKGLEGMEFQFNDILSPDLLSGKRMSYGDQLFLTIDANLQFSLEKLVQESMDKTKADGAMLLVVSAKTGEILAYVSNPSFDLNNYGKASVLQRINLPAVYAYEPGSVFKVFSVASLLELGGIVDESSFKCTGVFEQTAPNGETFRIRCYNGAAHGIVHPREILQYSCNVGLSQASMTVGSKEFYDKLRELGFGSQTGIELGGETNGIFRPVSKWSLRSKPTIAFGQEISVSALQMVSAATSLANKGNRLQLTLVSKIQDHEGNIISKHTPKVVSKPFSEDTVNKVLSYMETTGLKGSGWRALVGDVPMGVKTGTAQMTDIETGKYSEEDITSSCMALFPVDDPEIILYSVVIKAKGDTLGSHIAAPLIKNAANVVIDYLAMERESALSVTHQGVISLPESQTLEMEDKVPDFTGMSKRALASLLGNKAYKIQIYGEGYVYKQNPPAGTAVTEGMEIELYLQ